MGSPSNLRWSAAPGTPLPAISGNSGRVTGPIKLGSPGNGLRGTGTLLTPDDGAIPVPALVAALVPNVIGASGGAGTGGNVALPTGAAVDVPTTDDGLAIDSASDVPITLSSNPILPDGTFIPLAPAYPPANPPTVAPI